MKIENGKSQLEANSDEKGRIGYVILYFLGVPVGALIVLWALLGDYIFKAG